MLADSEEEEYERIKAEEEAGKRKYGEKEHSSKNSSGNSAVN